MAEEYQANIWENPLLRRTHASQRAELRNRFPELDLCPHHHFLALRKYTTGSPQRFFTQSVYSKFLNWLNSRDRTARKRLQDYLSDHFQEVNGAFLHLQEINYYEWHDHFEKWDDYELMRLIDQNIHPTFLRLIEAVLAPFLRIPAYFSRLDGGKDTEGLDIWCIVQELQETDLSEGANHYRHIIRNGIAHGGITYLMDEIRYRDKKGNEETYGCSEIVRTFDDLLDTCNAISLALSLFLLTDQPHGYELPQQLLIEELREETSTPWWEIVGCIASQLPLLNQLTLYACARTSDYERVQISAFQSGVLGEMFAPGYDRYFLSIHSTSSPRGWAGFDGKKLRHLRLKPETLLEDYRGVVEKDLIFYVPRFKLPRILIRFLRLVSAIRLSWSTAMADLRKQQGLPDISVREAKVHRNGWRCVLNASVYVQIKEGDINQDIVRKWCGRIIRRALCEARRRAPLTDAARYLPLGFARVAIFRKDHRAPTCKLWSRARLGLHGPS